MGLVTFQLDDAAPHPGVRIEDDMAVKDGAAHHPVDRQAGNFPSRIREQKVSHQVFLSKKLPVEES